MTRRRAKTRRTGRRPPGRPRGTTGDETRERIVAVGLQTFARQGLAGTSVRDIARQARIRVSSLYHYFPSKEALYQAVQERAHVQIRELILSVMARKMSLRRVAREAIGRLFDFLLRHRAYAQLGYRTGLEYEALAADQRIADRWLGLTESAIKPAEARGQVKAVDPALFMITMDALLHWHVVNDAFYRRMLGRGLDDPAVARRAREHIIQVGLRTLGLDQARAVKSSERARRR